MIHFRQISRLISLFAEPWMEGYSTSHSSFLVTLSSRLGCVEMNFTVLSKSNNQIGNLKSVQMAVSMSNEMNKILKNLTGTIFSFRCSPIREENVTNRSTHHSLI